MTQTTQTSFTFMVKEATSEMFLLERDPSGSILRGWGPIPLDLTLGEGRTSGIPTTSTGLVFNPGSSQPVDFG